MDLHSEDQEYFDTFTQQQKDDHLLAAAASLSHIEAVKIMELLVNAGANVNYSSQLRHSNRPLIAAVSRGHIASVAWLIQAGAELSASTSTHETALSRAIMKNLNDKAFLLFCMMSEVQLQKERHLNHLRISTFEVNFCDMSQEFEALNQQKNIAFTQTLKPLILLINHQIAENPFFILPIELKRLICCQFWELSKQNMLENCYLEPLPKPLIFSLMAPKIKKQDAIESLCNEVSSLQVTTTTAHTKKKVKMPKGCSIF